MELMICYFCNSAVEEKGFVDRTEVVTCSTCGGRYQLDDDALRFVLKREDDEKILNEEDKKKLSAYVKTKFDPKTGKPVWIDTDVIFNVTGKRSVNIRYR